LREGWQRGEAALALDHDQVDRLIREAICFCSESAGDPPPPPGLDFSEYTQKT
jgi:hypothetical protein